MPEITPAAPPRTIAMPDTPAQSPDDDILERVFGPRDEAREGDGFRCGYVALVGRPNVGKSTLLNRLVGEKVAIVSPRPQTTRRRILGIRNTDQAQAVFVDTPGIHTPKHALGRSMVKAARAAIPDADLVVWVVDVSRPPSELDAGIADLIRRSGRPVILALNKSDRLAPEHIEAHTRAYVDLAGSEQWVLTIATRGHNLDALWALIVRMLPQGTMFFPPDQLTDQTDRMLAAELIREAALYALSEEVPHGIEVLIEEWARREDGLLRISAKLLVERERHKAIVIGEGGQMIKQIGSQARRQIEKLLETRVFLELFVAVRSDWRKQPSEVRRLGFE